MADSEHSHESGAVVAHVAPVRLYAGILGALLFLTALTIAAYNVRLGEWNLIIAVAIATIKASLVVLFFMHMLHETKFNVAVFLGALVFGGVFLVYTMNDTEYRSEVDEFSSAWVDPSTGMRAYGTAEELIKSEEQEAEPEAAGLAPVAAPQQVEGEEEVPSTGSQPPGEDEGKPSERPTGIDQEPPAAAARPSVEPATPLAAPAGASQRAGAPSPSSPEPDTAATQ